MANSVDPDEMAHYEPSHLDLHCLHRYLVSVGMKGFMEIHSCQIVQILELNQAFFIYINYTCLFGYNTFGVHLYIQTLL